MREDTDSYILELVTEDPFRTMRHYSFKYGWRKLDGDSHEVTKDIWSSVAEWVEKHPSKFQDPKIPPLEVRNTTGVTTFYNNFEIVDVGSSAT